MGRSNPVPVFLSVPGARFTTTLLAGIVNPHDRSAAFTRSRDSCTDASAIPTIAKPGIPFETLTSTSTATASTPRTAAARTVQRPLAAIMTNTR